MFLLIDIFFTSLQQNDEPWEATFIRIHDNGIYDPFWHHEHTKYLVKDIDDKFQNQQYVVEGGVAKYYYHPYMQNIVLFVSLACAFPISYIFNKIKGKREASDIQGYKQIGEDKPKFNPLLVLVNTLCDTVGSLLQGIALNFIPASSYQIMRGGTIATTFLFSILYLKMKMQRYHIVGVLLAILGIFVIGCTSLIYQTSSAKTQSSALELAGYILLIVSLFFHGFLHVYEEKLMRTYGVQPIQLMGYSGFFGIVVNVALTAAATFISCPFGSDACAYDDSGSPYHERPEMYFRQLGENTPLLIFCIFELVSIFFFNLCGISITKYVNAIARSICDVSRTVLIWTVGIIITVTVGTNEENYRWERTQVGAILLQIIGFVLLVFGNLIYNQIIMVCHKKDEELLEKEPSLSGSRLVPSK